MSGGPGGEMRHLQEKISAGPGPCQMPVDVMGRPACTSTMEPTTAAKVRDCRKLTYTEEEKAAHAHEAAGMNSLLLRHNTPKGMTSHFAAERGKKILENNPIARSSIPEVAFNRTDTPQVFDANYCDKFKDKVGLASFEVHKRVAATSKKCIHVDHHALIHDLVFNNDIDEAHHIDPELRKLFANSAGVGKSLEFGRKKQSMGTGESMVGHLMHNREPEASKLNEGHANNKLKNGSAGMLSADLFRP